MKAINRAGNLKRITTHPDRTRRRKAAQLRATERAARTTAEQLAKLDMHGHVARKERAKLSKLMEE